MVVRQDSERLLAELWREVDDVVLRDALAIEGASLRSLAEASGG